MKHRADIFTIVFGLLLSLFIIGLVFLAGYIKGLLM
jgi:hypothetical protein